ncbi:hypothetical protein XENORESO_011617, partial [Xenotaenia resolanae]
VDARRQPDFRVMDVHQDRLQLLAEKRKWQTEMENKHRQLEDEKRALQHLKLCLQKQDKGAWF